MLPKPKHLILIHGAWAGAWVWDGLRSELGALGWPCAALELPGNGYHPMPARDVCEEDYMRALSDAITAVSGPVALIGHSGGGMLVSAAADRFPDRVSHAIWIAGMLIPDGRTFDDITAALPGDASRLGVSPYIRASPDGTASLVPTAQAAHYFFHDLDAAAAQAAAERLTPQPNAGRRIRTRTGAAFAQISKLYICATQDRSVVPAAQQAMCAMCPDITRVDVATGHVPHVSHPIETARIIHKWLRAD